MKHVTERTKKNVGNKRLKNEGQKKCRSNNNNQQPHLSFVRIALWIERSKIWKSTAKNINKTKRELKNMRIENRNLESITKVKLGFVLLFSAVIIFSSSVISRNGSENCPNNMLICSFHRISASFVFNSIRYYCFTFCSRQNPSASTRLLRRSGKWKHDTHELEIDTACWWEFKWFLFSTQRTLYICRLSSFQCLSFWMVVVFDMFIYLSL